MLKRYNILSLILPFLALLSLMVSQVGNASNISLLHLSGDCGSKNDRCLSWVEKYSEKNNSSDFILENLSANKNSQYVDLKKPKGKFKEVLQVYMKLSSGELVDNEIIENANRILYENINDREIVLQYIENNNDEMLRRTFSGELDYVKKQIRYLSELKIQNDIYIKYISGVLTVFPEDRTKTFYDSLLEQEDRIKKSVSFIADEIHQDILYATRLIQYFEMNINEIK